MATVGDAPVSGWFNASSSNLLTATVMPTYTTGGVTLPPAYYPTMQTAEAPPAPPRDPIAWLDDRIAEITDLAFAA